jgi:hypothetical protein
MIGTLHGKRSEHAVSEAMNSLHHLDFSGGSQPAVWTTTTMWLRNPYLRILYSRMLDHNLLFAPTNSIAATMDLRKRVPAQIPVVMHLHWLHPILHGIKDRDKARAALESYIKQLTAAKAMGISIVWTIHNVLPHDAVFEDLEMELQRRVLELCDAVHEMSDRTREMCAEWFSPVPAEVIRVPHPSYHGAYPDYLSRTEARMHLGISQGETVFLLFGAIKPYKGLLECAAAVDALALTEPVRLLVAGKADQSEDTKRFLHAASTNPAMSVHAEFIDEVDVQVFFRAADIAVLPYLRTLNSGSLALALTFGLPVVMPQDSGSLPLLDPSFALTFDGTSTQGLREAMRTSLTTLHTPLARAAAAAAGERVRSDVVADEFARQSQAWISRHNAC